MNMQKLNGGFSYMKIRQRYAGITKTEKKKKENHKNCTMIILWIHQEAKEHIVTKEKAERNFFLNDGG